ncbi:KTSC domain-containing protein [Chromobacterium aquaticum]|uniref:KTSC domain-containing protein n=1 Tax=Chromobacterium aquaticum TaxID=467180 RepID=A0ABV8ZYR9_9NEIS|nr:KTSC domain-containing protein [Chromobacterium aquaticum]MCD5362786.1 KTSC domain-containing protein [Chromobacterium aquaticum]
MERTRVSSSTIRSIGYNEATSTLEVEFLNGHVYQYFSVPFDRYQRLMASNSKGSFLASRIKGNYRYRQVR